MPGNLKNNKRLSMDRPISISLELNTIKEIHMAYLKNYTQKNSLLVFKQIVYGITQEQEELKSKWEEVKAVAKGR